MTSVGALICLLGFLTRYLVLGVNAAMLEALLAVPALVVAMPFSLVLSEEAAFRVAFCLLETGLGALVGFVLSLVLVKLDLFWQVVAVLLVTASLQVFGLIEFTM